MKTVPKPALAALFSLGGPPLKLEAAQFRIDGSDSVPSVAAACALLEARDAAVAAASEATCRAFGYDSRGADFREKCQRDMRIVVNYAALAMSIDDHAFLEERMLHWLDLVFSHLSFPEHAISIRSAYSILRQELVNRVAPKHRAECLPYLDQIMAVLCRAGGER